MIQTMTFDQFYQNWVNQWAAEMSTPQRPVTPDLPQGNFARAVAKSDANQATVLQFQAISTINFSRAATCSGADLDSFYAQFNFPRIQSEYANGTVTYSSGVVLQQAAIIPVGSIVTTPGAGISYEVIADPSYPNYIVATNSYQIPVGQSSGNAAVRAQVPGASFNVQAGQLSNIFTPLAGISSVTNALAITSGQAAETDDQYRARFIKYINGLSMGTEDAIYEAVASLQSGLKIKLVENALAIGNPVTSLVYATDNSIAYGNIIAFYDDGTGSPSTALELQVQSAVANTVAYGIRYQIRVPAILNPAISIAVRLKPGAVTATVLSNIALQIKQYVNSLAIGGDVDDGSTGAGWLYLSEIARQAYVAAPLDVVSVDIEGGVLIASLAQDYLIQPYQELILALTDINVVTY